MKKIYLKILLLILIIMFLYSCVSPPKDISTINILDWLNELITKFNAINLNEEKQKRFIGEEIQTKKILIEFKKNCTIHFNTIKENESDFIYSLDNNSFILKKAIYVTLENKEIYFTFDINKNQWIKLDIFESGNNIENNYNFKCLLNEKKDRFEIFLTSALKIKEKLNNIINLNKEKKIVKLSSNMIITNDNDKSTITIDLNKEILFIPEETLFSGELNVSGNIISINKNQNGIDITALVDIFIYINKKMLNISFDREKWILSLPSIDFLPKLTIKSINEKTINFILDVNLAYKE